MKWYPWLNEPYKKILATYQKKQGHHAILLYSQQNNGEASLAYAISRWLICQNSNKIKSCNICHNCQLMKSDNHPDYYKIIPEKERQNLGVENIRILIDYLHGRAHYGGNKVVWIANIEQMTEQAINVLLKTLEEPPNRTYFILGSKNHPIRLLPTLYSRCLCWPLLPISEINGLHWLQKNNFSNIKDIISIKTALRLSNGAIIAAQTLLQSTWQARLNFFLAIMQAISCENFLILLPILNLDKNNDTQLQWLFTLLLDILKWQHGVRDYLINIDQIKLISILASRWSIMKIHGQLQQWLVYQYQWQRNSGINRELFLVNFLLNWEGDIKKIK